MEAVLQELTVFLHQSSVDEAVLVYLANYVVDEILLAPDYDFDEVVELFLTYAPEFAEMNNYREHLNTFLASQKAAYHSALRASASSSTNHEIRWCDETSQPVHHIETAKENPTTSIAASSSSSNPPPEPVYTSATNSLHEIYSHIPKWFIFEMLGKHGNNVDVTAALLLDTPPEAYTAGTIMSGKKDERLSKDLGTEVRERIIGRYSLLEEKENAELKSCKIDTSRVWTASDTKIRYLDSKVVTTKGDKFKVPPKEKDAEE